MVLPTAQRPSHAGAATSGRGSLYEAGNGHILSHFAELATPDVRHAAANRANGSDVPRRGNGAGGRGGSGANATQKPRTRRSLDGANSANGYRALPGKADASSALAAFAEDVTMDNNYRGGTDHDMEDALFGAPAESSNNNDEVDNNGQEKLVSRQEKLDAWRRQKEEGGNRSMPSSGSKAVQQQRPKDAKQQPLARRVFSSGRDADGDGSANNQSNDGESSGQMFTMDFSPPRHNRSNKSRQPTLEADSVASLGVDSSDKRKQNESSSSEGGGNQKSWKDASSVLNVPFTSGESFSPAMSMEFLGRDLEDEERALRAKSDKERAFLYKKRYIDTYGLLVAMARRVKNLETVRADWTTEVELLRSKVHTQERIIETMNQNEIMSIPGGNKQEKRIQSLCREVGVLVQQLGERDAIISHLHDERDESVRAMNEIKLSHAACARDSATAMETSLREDAEYAALKQDLEVQMQEKKALEEHLSTMNSKVDAMVRQQKLLHDQLTAMNGKLADAQQLYAASESQREALSNGLQQTEKQVSVLHGQWEQEKAELLTSASRDEKKTAALVADRDHLRNEVSALKNLLKVSFEKEAKSASIIESQRKTASEQQQYIAQLESELRAMRAQLASLGEQEKHFARVESELAESNQELIRRASRISDLEYDLEEKERELQDAETNFREKTVFMEKRLFQAEIVRRSLHNKVMELKGNIRVFCRVRPVLRHEMSSAGNEEIFSFPDYNDERRQIELAASTKSHISYGQNGGRDAVKKYNFDFDLVFNSSCSQEEVFLEVSALVQSALDGYNVCIFALQVCHKANAIIQHLLSSGKTYTMQGREDSAGFATMEPSSHMGIVGRAIMHIFATIADLRSSGWEFTVSLEMIEIYNETLRDLLAPAGSADKVDLRLDAEGKPAIANSCIHTVINELDAWQLLQKAMSKRSTKATNMNDRSSRSHCVITFRMNGVNSLTGDRRLGVVHLVDLAFRKWERSRTFEGSPGDQQEPFLTRQCDLCAREKGMKTQNALACCSCSVPGLEADAFLESVAGRRQQDTDDLQPVSVAAAPRRNAQLAAVRKDC
ncbi:hypothetical protein FI667_g12619, partial [Globisporangium splendens]